MFCKKNCMILCVCVSLVVIAAHLSATEVYVENYSFEEPGSGKFTNWDRVPGWDSDTTAEDSGLEENPWYGVTDGDWVGFLMASDPSVFNLTDFVIPEGVSFTLKVDAEDLWSETPPAILEMSLFYDDNGSRVTVATQNVEPTPYDDINGVPVFTEYSLVFNVSDVPESVGHCIGIEFNNVTPSGASWIAIDNVRLDVNFAGIVYPPDGAVNIPVDADLQWTLKEGMTCDVYFGTENDPNFHLNPKVIENEFQTAYDPGILDFETTYYWRVDPIGFDPNNGSPFVYEGEIWSFTTMGTEVVISTQPKSITVSSGTNAVFIVEALSPSDMTYAWYKQGNPTVLSTTDTLSISNVQTGDEGYYYCEVTNVEGTVTSQSARLLTQRLIGWWKLDGDAVDSINLEVEGVPAHDGVLPVEPNFVDGIDGSGIAFFGDGKIISITDSSEYFNFYPQGLTVSTWINCALEGTWDGVLGKQENAADWATAGWVIGVNDNSGWGPLGADVTLRGVWTDMFGNPDDGDINDDLWHLVVLVIEPDYSDRTCVMHIYVDGVIRNTSPRFNMDTVPLSSSPVIIGAENELGEDLLLPRGSFHGKVDDVKIYSYALDAVEIGTLYLNFNPDEKICLNPDDPWRYFDVAGEPGESSWCRIDIEDFAEFVAVWMNCNVLPDCLM